jgi:hypothetical protein
MRTTISSSADPSNPFSFRVIPEKKPKARLGQPSSKSGHPSSRLQLCQPANGGDHPLIFHFLRSATQAPSETEFEHTRDHFNYHPNQRLLIRSDGSIVAHMRMVERDLRFGTAVVPSIDLTELATYPGIHESLCRRLLVSAARQRAIERGVCLLTTRSLCEEIERRPGWTGFRYGNDVTLSVENLLAGLETDVRRVSHAGEQPDSAPQYGVQPWRYLEKDSIRHLYDLVTSQCRGAVCRGDEYWQWLVQRRGFDKTLIAIDQRAIIDRSSPLPPAAVVAYLFASGSRILELIAHPHHPVAIQTLLRRFAHDLLEKGNHSVTVAANSIPQALGLFEAWRHRAAQIHWQSQVLGACAVSAESLLQRMAPVLIQRPRDGGQSKETVLGFVCGTEEFTLQIARRRVRILRKATGRDRIIASSSSLSRILLGVADIHSEIDSGRVTFTTRTAFRHACRLFPSEPFWRMPLDDQAAIG